MFSVGTFILIAGGTKIAAGLVHLSMMIGVRDHRSQGDTDAGRLGKLVLPRFDEGWFARLNVFPILVIYLLTYFLLSMFSSSPARICTSPT